MPVGSSGTLPAHSGLEIGRDVPRGSGLHSEVGESLSTCIKMVLGTGETAYL